MTFGKTNLGNTAIDRTLARSVATTGTDHDDIIDCQTLETPSLVTIHGEDGDDTITGSKIGDIIFAGPGDDKVDGKEDAMDVVMDPELGESLTDCTPLIFYFDPLNITGHNLKTSVENDIANNGQNYADTVQPGLKPTGSFRRRFSQLGSQSTSLTRNPDHTIPIFLTAGSGPEQLIQRWHCT